MDRSAIILAAGSPSKLIDDSGVVELNGKPLVNYVVDAVKGLVGEIIIVISSSKLADVYSKLVSSTKVKISIVESDSNAQLNSVLAGFRSSNSEYSLLVPYNAPFISRQILSLLFELCVNKTAAVPRWTNDEIEPLQAVYRTKAMLDAVEKALEQKESDLKKIINKLRGVRYISSLVIEQFDPNLSTFFRINNSLDLKKASAMIERQRKKRK